MFQENETANRFEAQLLKAVIESQSQVNCGMLAIKDITDTYNRDLSEHSRVSPITVGRTLRAMGFQPRRLSSGAAGIYWDETAMARLKDQYGLEKPLHPSASLDRPGLPADAAEGSSEGARPLPSLPQTTMASPIKDSEGFEECKGFSKPAGGLSHTPLSFSDLFQDANPHRAFTQAGHILNRLMAERNLRWDRLHAYIKEQHPTLYEKTRAVQRRIFEALEMYLKQDRDAESLSPEFVQDLKTWLALRIYWIGLCSAYQRQGGGASGSPETIPK